MKKPLSSKDKLTQKMTRDGLVEINETKDTMRRVSQREQEIDLTQSIEQPEAAELEITESVVASSSGADPPPEQNTGTIEQAAEHIEATHTRKASKKAAKRAERAATSKTQATRLQFTDEERQTTELERYIRKAEKAADRAERAQAAVPKQRKLVAERVYDEAKGKSKTRLRFEESEKPISPKTNTGAVIARPAQEAGIYVHNKIHSVEKENVGVEGAHKSEKAAERVVKQGGRQTRHSVRSRKLKPYRAAAKAEKTATKANTDYLYHKVLYENPQLTSNPISRMWQKKQKQKQYEKAARTGGAATVKAAKNIRKSKKKAEKTKDTAAFIVRHRKGIAIVATAMLLFVMLFSGISVIPSVFSGAMNSVLGTSYTSEDADLVAVDRAYEAKENELQNRINNIEREYPGYDEYCYDLAEIFHNPHEIASYLTAKYQSYTLPYVQGELSRIFKQQYTLTLTQEVETRYREETHTETYTDEEGNTYMETVTEQVPYNYYILNVTLKNTPPSSFLPQQLDEEQRKMYAVYLETSGNKPLVFGGGSYDTSPSTDLSGVHFVNGKRPGNTAVVDIAKQQEGNVGGYPYWSWYGFDGRVEWCACFVSWCYNQAGLSEPRFAACQSQGVAWFTSRGQWGARGYKDIAPGDAIFFDWDLDGSADHVGIVIGKDNERIYTVEGNSGDACKIKSYSLNYECIKGYGLMNWD